MLVHGADDQTEFLQGFENKRGSHEKNGEGKIVKCPTKRHIVAVTFLREE